MRFVLGFLLCLGVAPLEARAQQGHWRADSLSLAQHGIVLEHHAEFGDVMRLPEGGGLEVVAKGTPVTFRDARGTEIIGQGERRRVFGWKDKGENLVPYIDVGGVCLVFLVDVEEEAGAP